MHLQSLGHCIANDRQYGGTYEGPRPPFQVPGTAAYQRYATSSDPSNPAPIKRQKHSHPATPSGSSASMSSTAVKLEERSQGIESINGRGNSVPQEMAGVAQSDSVNALTGPDDVILQPEHCGSLAGPRHMSESREVCCAKRTLGHNPDARTRQCI